jgi:hypothetical protein
MITVSTDHARWKQQEIERFGSDENVRRLALKSCAIGGGGISGADRDRRGQKRVASGRRQPRDAGQRRAQVAFDVDGERFERRHVEHPAALRLGRRRREHHTIEAP